MVLPIGCLKMLIHQKMSNLAPPGSACIYMLRRHLAEGEDSSSKVLPKPLLPSPLLICMSLNILQISVELPSCF
jgi:hypothetical protein